MKLNKVVLLTIFLFCTELIYAQGRFRFYPVVVSGGGSGSGCNGSCVVDQTFPVSTYSQNASMIKTGGGACAGFGTTADIISGGDVTTHLNSTDTGNCSAIHIDANHSAGGGGRGIRHWRGSGVNTAEGNLQINFPSVGPEFWMSYVMKHAAGMTFLSGIPSYTKDWYNDTAPIFILGHQGGAWGFHTTNNYGGTLDWTNTPGDPSDGNWDCFDFYFNYSTNTAVLHLNGTQTMNRIDINFFGKTSVDYFFNSNQSNVTTAGFAFFDDIRIDNNLASSTTRIGCLGF